MRRIVLALAVVGMLPAASLLPVTMMSGAAFAEETQSPEKLVRDGLEKVMAAITLFVGSIPMYAPPEVLPNGDIIIRRVNPDNDEEEPSITEEEPDSTPKDT